MSEPLLSAWNLYITEQIIKEADLQRSGQKEDISYCTLGEDNKLALIVVVDFIGNKNRTPESHHTVAGLSEVWAASTPANYIKAAAQLQKISEEQLITETLNILTQEFGAPYHFTHKPGACNLFYREGYVCFIRQDLQ